MARVESVALTGKSGTNYSFLINHIGTPLPAVGVVYALLRDRAEQRHENGRTVFIYPERTSEERRQWTVLYIGQTGNLSQRFDHYEMDDDLARINPSHIAMIGETSAEYRIAIERDLIQRYATMPQERPHHRRKSLVESITIMAAMAR